MIKRTLSMHTFTVSLAAFLSDLIATAARSQRTMAPKNQPLKMSPPLNGQTCSRNAYITRSACAVPSMVHAHTIDSHSTDFIASVANSSRIMAPDNKPVNTDTARTEQCEINESKRLNGETSPDRRSSIPSCVRYVGASSGPLIMKLGPPFRSMRLS